MSSSILSSIMGILDAPGVSSLSGRLDEPESAVSSGIASSVAAMIGGLANKADGPSSMRQIFDLVSTASPDVNVSNLTTVSNGIGRVAGLSSSAASKLMGMAAPILLSVLGRRVREGDLTPRSLRSDLVGEPAGIKQLLPIGLPNLLGSVTQPVAEASRAVAGLGELITRKWPGGVAMQPGLISTEWYDSRSVTPKRR